MDTMHHDIDPQIPLAYALAKVGGSQAELARKLNVKRASVHDWKRRGLQYLPPLQAHRFVRIFGERPSAAA